MDSLKSPFDFVVYQDGSVERRIRDPAFFEKPNSVDNHRVVLILQGSATPMYVDYGYFVPAIPPFLSQIPANTPYLASPSTPTMVWAVEYKQNLVEDMLPTDYNHRNRGYLPLGDETAKQLETLCVMMHQRSNEIPQDLSIIRHLLCAYLLIIGKERQTYNKHLSTQIQRHGWNDFQAFIRLVEEHYKDRWTVETYARTIGLSSRSLNDICRANTRRSPGALIEERRMTEAKKMLINSDVSIAEIALRLNYNDQAYFSRAFKRNCSICPTEFRSRLAALISSD